MILNAVEIETALKNLKEVLAEQERILRETDQVILNDLTVAWECKAQAAYADAYLSVKEHLLLQINQLIGLFGKALQQTQNGLYQVDVDISHMNSNAI